MTGSAVTLLTPYPVKSLADEAPESVQTSLRGFDGDRLWAVRDIDGKLGSGKCTRRFRRMPGLLELSAAYEDGLVVDVVTPGTVRIHDTVRAR